MTGQEYRDAIAKLGLNQLQAGRFLHGSPRSSRRWAAEGPPPLEAMVLDLMLRRGLMPTDVNPEWKP